MPYTLDEMLKKENEFPSLEKAMEQPKNSEVNRAFYTNDTQAANFTYGYQPTMPMPRTIDAPNQREIMNGYDYIASQNAERRAEMENSLNYTSKTQMAAKHEQNAALKRRGKLSKKGIVIVSSLAVAIVTVFSLILGFGSKINSGKALMPASNPAKIVAFADIEVR